MIRVSAPLPGGFRVSGGPIVASLMFMLYVMMLMFWLMFVSVIYLVEGAAYLAITARNAWQQRHPKPRALGSTAHHNS